MSSFHIPEHLQMVRSYLLQSSVPCLELTPTKASFNQTASLFGHSGYVLGELHVPKDILGKEMLLLAQINFSQLHAPSPFPKQGLVQFYVSNDCLQTKQHYQGVISQNHFKVVYIEQPDEIYTDSNMNSFQGVLYPIRQTVYLTGVTVTEPVSIFDYRFHHFIPKEKVIQLAQDENYPFDEIYLQYYSGAQHKVGGYAYFIHDDLRKHALQLQHYDTLLLQIISDDSQGIMWGDSGVIKFFINFHDLLHLKFEHTIMYVEDYS
ncbi:MAG: YwqG family protein [Lysinibacillus sp.]